MIVTSKRIDKLLNMRKGIIGKIVILYVMMFMLLLTPVIYQNYNSFKQSQAYSEIIDNIIYANQLNMDVSERILPRVWNVVAGKEGFNDSGIVPLILDIRTRMSALRDNTDSEENRTIMDKFTGESAAVASGALFREKK